MTESQVVSKLVRKLNEHGHFWKSADRFRAGVPDIVGCYKGRFAGIEVKVEYNKPSPIQIYTMLQIIKHGGYAGLVTYSNKTKLWWIHGEGYSFSESVEEILRVIDSGGNHIEN